MDEHYDLFILDSNGVQIDLGSAIDLRSFFIPKHAHVDLTVRKCEYISAVKGITPVLNEHTGQMENRTSLSTGTFQVNKPLFIERITEWYNLKYKKNDWFSNNNVKKANWVKQKIQAALLPFSIPKRDQDDIYHQLQIACQNPDAEDEPLKIITADELNSKVIARPPFIVDKIMCAGLTLLAAPAKTGKSFLALDLACCISEGKPFWGLKTSKGSVLYCDLEGADWRTQERLPIVGRASRTDCPKLLSNVYNVPRVDDGLIDRLTAWIDSADTPRLIIIDTLQHIKGRVARGEDAYSADTRFLKPLHDLAIAKGIAILVVTHTRKSNGLILDDPFDAVIGSTAQYGNSDGGWIIAGKRNEDKKQFVATGRDYESVSFEIERSKNGRWVCNGTTEEAQERTQYSEYQKDQTVSFIKNSLQNHGGTWTCTAQQFLDEALRETGEYLATDATRISRKLHELAPQLLKNDRITILFPTSGGPKGRRITIRQNTFTE